VAGAAKAGTGRSGARMYLIQSPEELVRCCASVPDLWLPDNLPAAPEHFDVDPPAASSAWSSRGELLYAMRVISHGAFNLCPSET